ncbi:MAG: HEAT repeat domain-containing protein [Phormidesmis sp. FL-bin-119]|nr:HEAT repeat domain-containing protein [Pedobacter sp.]
MDKKNFLLLILTIVLLGILSSYSINSKKTVQQVNGPQVPEGYTVEVVAGPDLVDFPMFSVLDETGRLFVFESTGNVYTKSEDAIKNPQFRIKLLEDTNEDGVYDKSVIYADKVGFPQGGVFYKGSLYASSAPDLLKLTDTNGDGVADKREVLLTGWTLNVNANSLIGPSKAPDGWLYMNSAIMGFDVMTKEGVQLKGATARTWRVNPDGSGLEWISAGGMNNPVELTFTEASEPIGTETYFTDPTAGERDALVYWTEGGVYPKPNNNIDRDKLVRTGELMPVVTKYSRVSPSGICRYRSNVFGNDFKDNLFSAQFNTHQVVRHKLFRDGASFRTEDDVFFWSKNEDFHPTDVLEDADGSLLIVETGGWFVKGCPLSQVSKPELKGSIYRVRKKETKTVVDPYGNQISWKSQQPSMLSKYLEGERPFVSDRAVELLVDFGAASVEPLTNLLNKSLSANARTKAVFALYRIGTPEALISVRKTLKDANLQVRVAAARSLGLAKDPAAVGGLMELVLNNDPAVRRQAATALGQIGDKRAVSTLLIAAADTDDRFIRHALIYSLISINEPTEVRKGLTHVSPKVREAALIALDQMPKSPLKMSDVTNFLTSNNPQLQRTGLWVASHHPDWSNEMIVFLRSRFIRGPLTSEEALLFSDILVSFSEDVQMQQFMADQIKQASKERKLFFLGAMGKSSVKEFPKAWVEQVGLQLSPEIDPQVKAKALELVSLRSISSLADKLRTVADDNNNSVVLRVQAIAALLKTNPKFSEKHFTYLYDQLKESKETPVRQQVASVLVQGEISEVQLLKLATEYLHKGDAFVLPRLIPIFQGAHSVEIAKALVSTLSNSPSLDGFSEANLRKIFEKYPPDVKPLVEQLITKLNKVQAGRLERLKAFESQIEMGKLDRGRILFLGKALCYTCHTIGSRGGNFGPDLTSIQKDRSAHDLLEGIVYPDVSFVREFETYKIKTKTNDYTGIMREQTPDAIVFATSPQTSVRIPRNEIISTEILDMSMMPNGFDKLLTSQEMADLMTFLLGQDQDPSTDQRILRK